MLGLKKSSRPFKWGAFGKHPVAGDYFWTGEKDPLFNLFSGWVENGYVRLAGMKDKEPTLTSWRFFAGTGQSDTLLCGICRDSFDRVGRPYPLVIMGAGRMPEWPRHWHLLPFALEEFWGRAEYLAARRYVDFSELEADVKNLKSPGAAWSDHEASGRQRMAAAAAPESLLRESGTDEDVYAVRLGPEACRDVAATVSLWLSRKKQEAAATPGAVFLGGGQNSTSLVIYRRALSNADFVELWSAESKTERT